MSTITRIDLDHRSGSTSRRTRAKHLIDLSVSLARPVAAGLLPIGHADATLIGAAVRAARTGTIKTDAFDYANVLQHILRLNVHEITVRRTLATAAIRRSIAPLIALKSAARRLLAEAHNCNADFGFPLRERDVTEVVGIEVYAALHPEEAPQ
jgi:hypothetical protein